MYFYFQFKSVRNENTTFRNIGTHDTVYWFHFYNFASTVGLYVDHELLQINAYCEGVGHLPNMKHSFTKNDLFNYRENQKMLF
jgi:hypothetical protein